jgi:hypothetical protein
MVNKTVPTSRFKFTKTIPPLTFSSVKSYPLRVDIDINQTTKT